MSQDLADKLAETLALSEPKEREEMSPVPWRLPAAGLLPKLFLEFSYPSREGAWWTFSQKMTTMGVKKPKMDPEQAKRHKGTEYWDYTFRDSIIYALGIGCKGDADLRYLYECHPQFAPLPTYAVAPGVAACGLVGWPGIEVDLCGLVHGEQYLEVFRPLPAEGKIRSETRVVDILDKKSGALIIYEVTSFDDRTGEKLAVQQLAMFQIGAGGFGGERANPEEVKAATIPDREPDSVVEELVPEHQHILYRLGGLDLNPLHIDPSFAGATDFKKPILQGLGTFGYAFRHLLSSWAQNDAGRFKAIKVRFSFPVFPGQTLRTESWREGDRIVFQVKVRESQKTAISNGWCTFKEISD